MVRLTFQQATLISLILAVGTRGLLARAFTWSHHHPLFRRRYRSGTVLASTRLFFRSTRPSFQSSRRRHQVDDVDSTHHVSPTHRHEISTSQSSAHYHRSSTQLNMSTLSPPPSNGVDNEVDTLTGNGLPQETTATSTTVASASASSSASPSTASTACLEFARLIGRLKVTPRTGWVRRGVPMRYESVADHSWRVAALSLLLLVDSNQEDDKNNDNKDNNALLHNTSPVAPDEQLPTERQATSGTLDVAKCMQLAIVHDLAECIVGDIAPDDNIPKEVKKAREMQAMSTIASVLGRATRTLSTQGPPRDEQPSSSSPISTAESFLLHLFHEYEERTSAEAIAVKDLDLLDMIVQAYEYEERFGMDLGDFFASTPPSKFQTPSLACMAHELHEQRASAKQTVDKKSLSTSTTSAQSNMSDQDEPQRQQQCELLSRADQAFVTEYAMASKLDAAEISNMLQAYHQWQHPR